MFGLIERSLTGGFFLFSVRANGWLKLEPLLFKTSLKLARRRRGVTDALSLAESNDFIKGDSIGGSFWLLVLL